MNTFFNANSGYCGYSMSKRAVQAYESGEMPISKWTKREILDELSNQDFDDPLLKKMTLAELRRTFCKYTSYHHTGKMFNRTDFYSVIADVTHEELENIIASREKKGSVKKETPVWEYVLLCHGEWKGTRRHPRLVYHNDPAIVIGNIAYFQGGSKRMNGNYTYITKTFSNIPENFKNDFEFIEHHRIPKSKLPKPTCTCSLQSANDMN